MLGDGICASLDHPALLLFVDRFEVFDESSQFGEQGHRAGDVVVGRLLFFEDEA